MRWLALVFLGATLAGCGCGPWREGTRTVRRVDYDPSLEPWVGHEHRAIRETQACNYLIGPNRWDRWNTGVNALGREGYIYWPQNDIDAAIWTQYHIQDRDLKSLAFKNYTTEHAMTVVALNPLIFVTYPKSAGEHWSFDRKIGGVRASTELTVGHDITVWREISWRAMSSSQPLVLEDGASHRIPTDWGTLVFTRNGGTYTVTTEGKSLITPSPPPVH